MGIGRGGGGGGGGRGEGVVAYKGFVRGVVGRLTGLGGCELEERRDGAFKL